MKIERVQYDGEGQWLDVVFDDGMRGRLSAGVVRALVELVNGERGEAIIRFRPTREEGNHERTEEGEKP